MCVRIVALLLLIFLCHGTTAQHIQQVFSKISVADGLSSATVTSIIKDDQGYLWVGTKDGLNKYDGYDFKIYRNDPIDHNSLIRNWILAVFQDSKGGIWVTTFGGGVHYYNRQKDKFIRVSGIDNPVITDIIEDRQGRLWFAGNALICFDLVNSRWHTYSHQLPDIYYTTISGIAQENENEFWVSMNDSFYLWNLKTKSYKKFVHEPGNINSLGSPRINTILKDDNGNLWIATRGAGLDRYHIESGKFTHYPSVKDESDGPLVNTIRTLCSDGNLLWLGTENGGLSKFDTRTNKFAHYYFDKNNPRGLSDNSIWSLYKDNEGRLWIGTFSFGLCVIDPYQNKFSAIKLPFENAVVNAVLKDQKKRLWIGTEGGIVRMQGDNTRQYLNEPTDRSKGGIPVLSIFEDSSGRIWIGTWNGGVFQYNETLDKFISIAKEGDGKYDLSNFNNYSIIESSFNKEILIASYDGLNILPVNFGELGVIKLKDTIRDYIRVLFEDSKGNIWVGSHTGIRLYNSAKKSLIPVFSNNSDRSGQLRVAVACIFEDSKGKLWVGTDSGLFGIESFSVTNHYTMADGFANHDVRGIQQDKKGNLWLSTNTGITMFNPDTQRLKNYDATDGIFSNGFKVNSQFRDSEGNIYFGGSDGIILIEPDKLVDNPYPPTVVLKDLKIFNKSIKIDAQDSILKSHISETKEITVGHDASMITVDFVALNFSASDKDQYAYQLKGFDHIWNCVGKTRSATYTNLSPGSYIFSVKASNNDGIWSNATDALTIHVLPPWWRTNWAYVMYAVVILMLLYLFRNIILMRAHFAHDIKMERLKLENAERLNRAKLDFFTNISHEFRTPLTIIIGLIENMNSSAIDHQIKNKLHTANLNASRLLRLVNELLDFRKTESGKMKLRVVERNIVSFIREIKLSFEPLAEQRQIGFSFHATADVVNAWIDTEQFEKVIVNLLSNAFKNTPTGGNVSLFIGTSFDKVIISVQDNGKGIKPEFLSSLFQTFFTADTDQRSPGTGIGLALTKNIVELHHGKIEVESIQNKSTRFNVTLLLGNKHFNDTEIITSDQDLEKMLPPSDSYIVDNVHWEVDDEGGTCERKLLIVDDNQDVRMLLTTMFGKYYTILEAPDGVSAWELAIREIPDIIISDVMMPDKDGISLCRELKSNINTCHIPIILLTARTSFTYQLEGLEMGADDYITKPFNGQLLFLKIRNLLQLRERSQKLFNDHRVLQVEPHQIAIAPRDQLFIETALKSVEDNIANVEYGVEDLGRDVGMSKTTLFRKLKAVTGQSANEFIRTIRLKRAAQLLALNQFTVSEIAYMVGFNDVKYFRSCFKRLFNLSPTDYSGREEVETSAEK